MIANDLLRWKMPEESVSRSGEEAFRADMDHSGRWYVWGRLGANGWATLHACDSRQDAERLAVRLNHDGDESP